LGHNETEILHSISTYATQNTSFQLVDRILGNQKSEKCETDCKTLRQFSNIRDAKYVHDLRLVDHLEATSEPKPNIFIIVVDSMRPDYLGAYNPKVDFTPHLDAFAHDSVVMRHAYSNYAGTSLSKPSIWTGALILHSHYARPFDKVDSLQKLARNDGYQMIISYETILRALLPNPSDFVKLDTDKVNWQNVEFSSTLEQLEAVLDKRTPQSPPVFFYAQPMNVQQHASNNLPKRTPQNWQSRPGFDDRIAYAVHQVDGIFETFITYLKARNLYENSIIIVAADHGDATGELGRVSHSIIIYPEVMRVPLIVHLPASMRSKYVYDENRLSALVDIAPSLYYLLGHKPIHPDSIFGRPMFVSRREEFDAYPREDMLLASDEHAAYGLLSGDGRWMYTTYDAPANSMLFDLQEDPTAQHDVLTPELKKKYDARIIQYLLHISDVYGYKPTGGK
jgi:arylsulfatase A-like enzyme